MEAIASIFALLVSPVAMWVIFIGTVIGFCIATGLLLYLWRTYGRMDRSIRRMRVIYFIGSFILLLSSLSFVFSLS